MANLSNINGKFVVDTAGNIGVGTLIPRSDANTTNISIQSSGTARLFVNNTGASGKEYAIYSSANGDFGIFDYGAVSARLVINSAGNATFAGNVGIGVTPYANSLSSGIDSESGLGLFGYNDGFYVSGNAYYNGAWKYKTSGFASKINSNSSGDVVISAAANGSADGAITWADTVTINNSGYTKFIKSTGGVIASFYDGTYGVDLAATATGGSIQTFNTNQTLNFNTYGTGDITFTTSGTSERMRIDSSGNVNIKTGTLSVGQSSENNISNTTGETWIGSNGLRYNSGSDTFARTSATAQAAMIVLTDTADTEFYAQPSTSQTGTYALTPKMVIKGATGNVGIAMIPIAALDSTLQICETGQTVISGGDIGGKAATFAGTGGASNSSIVTIVSTNTSVGAQQGGEIGFGGKFTTGSNQFAQFAKIMSYKADTVSGNYGGGLQFWTRANATPSAVKMTIDPTGNVGIGTTSPSAKLEVRGTAPTYTNSSTVFWGGTTNNDSHNGIMLSSYGDALGGSLASNLLYSNSNTPTQTNTNRSSGQIKFGNTTVAAKTSDINFGGYYKGTTTFVERMRITSAGYVAIPDTSGNHSGAASLIVTKKSSIPYQIWNYSGTSDSFRLEMDEYVTAGNVRQYFTQTNGGVSNGFSMTFNTGSVIFGDLEVASATQNSGSAFKKDSKARMTLCQASNSTTLTDLQEYFNPNGAVGKIQTSGSATLFTTSSDYRLKEDLKSFSGLEMVSKIPVYDFKWKISDERSYGVMAHELQEVLPQAVGGDKDYEKEHVVKKAEYDDDHNLIKDAEYGKRPSYQTVDYSKIVPLLVKSIQELKADNDSLKARIETLENN